MTEIMQELKKVLKKYNPSLYGKLNLSNEVKSQEVINDELNTFYKYINGYNESTVGANIGELYLIPGYMLISKKKATLIREQLVAKGLWSNDYYIFLEDGGGSFFFWNRNDNNYYSYLYGYGIELKFNSLKEVIIGIIDFYIDNKFSFDQEGYLDGNLDVFDKFDVDPDDYSYILEF